MANVKTDKEHIKKELRKLFRSMDFVSKKFLADEKAAGKDFQTYFNIYQQLGLELSPEIKDKVPRVIELVLEDLKK
jgi:hypothetical protein